MGEGGGENGSPHPHRFLFRPCADVRFLAKHTKKNRQLRRREVSESRENGRLKGLTGEKGAGSGREMRNAKLLSPFIYFVKSVRILSQNKEPSNINEVAVLAQSVERVNCRAGGRGFDSWGRTNTQGLKITEK